MKILQDKFSQFECSQQWSVFSALRSEDGVLDLGVYFLWRWAIQLSANDRRSQYFHEYLVGASKIVTRLDEVLIRSFIENPSTGSKSRLAVYFKNIELILEMLKEEKTDLISVMFPYTYLHVQNKLQSWVDDLLTRGNHQLILSSGGGNILFNLFNPQQQLDFGIISFYQSLFSGILRVGFELARKEVLKELIPDAKALGDPEAFKKYQIFLMQQYITCVARHFKGEDERSMNIKYLKQFREVLSENLKDLEDGATLVLEICDKGGYDDYLSCTNSESTTTKKFDYELKSMHSVKKEVEINLEASKISELEEKLEKIAEASEDVDSGDKDEQIFQETKAALSEYKVCGSNEKILAWLDEIFANNISISAVICHSLKEYFNRNKEVSLGLPVPSRSTTLSSTPLNSEESKLVLYAYFGLAKDNSKKTDITFIMSNLTAYSFELKTKSLPKNLKSIYEIFEFLLRDMLNLVIEANSEQLLAALATANKKDGLLEAHMINLIYQIIDQYGDINKENLKEEVRICLLQILNQESEIIFLEQKKLEGLKDKDEKTSVGKDVGLGRIATLYGLIMSVETPSSRTSLSEAKSSEAGWRPGKIFKMLREKISPSDEDVSGQTLLFYPTLLMQRNNSHDPKLSYNFLENRYKILCYIDKIAAQPNIAIPVPIAELTVIFTNEKVIAAIKRIIDEKIVNRNDFNEDNFYGDIIKAVVGDGFDFLNVTINETFKKSIIELIKNNSDLKAHFKKYRLTRLDSRYYFTKLFQVKYDAENRKFLYAEEKVLKEKEKILNFFTQSVLKEIKTEGAKRIIDIFSDVDNARKNEILTAGELYAKLWQVFSPHVHRACADTLFPEKYDVINDEIVIEFSGFLKSQFYSQGMVEILFELIRHWPSVEPEILDEDRQGSGANFFLRRSIRTFSARSLLPIVESKESQPRKTKWYASADLESSVLYNLMQGLDHQAKLIIQQKLTIEQETQSLTGLLEKVKNLFQKRTSKDNIFYRDYVIDKGFLFLDFAIKSVEEKSSKEHSITSVLKEDYITSGLAIGDELTFDTFKRKKLLLERHKEFVATFPDEINAVTSTKPLTITKQSDEDSKETGENKPFNTIEEEEKYWLDDARKKFTENMNIFLSKAIESKHVPKGSCWEIAFLDRLHRRRENGVTGFIVKDKKITFTMPCDESKLPSDKHYIETFFYSRNITVANDERDFFKYFPLFDGILEEKNLEDFIEKRKNTVAPYLLSVVINMSSLLSFGIDFSTKLKQAIEKEEKSEGEEKNSAQIFKVIAATFEETFKSSFMSTAIPEKKEDNLIGNEEAEENEEGAPTFESLQSRFERELPRVSSDLPLEEGLKISDFLSEFKKFIEELTPTKGNFEKLFSYFSQLSPQFCENVFESLLIHFLAVWKKAGYKESDIVELSVVAYAGFFPDLQNEKALFELLLNFLAKDEEGYKLIPKLHSNIIRISDFKKQNLRIPQNDNEYIAHLNALSNKTFFFNEIEGLLIYQAWKQNKIMKDVLPTLRTSSLFDADKIYNFLCADVPSSSGLTITKQDFLGRYVFRKPLPIAPTPKKQVPGTPKLVPRTPVSANHQAFVTNMSSSSSTSSSSTSSSSSSSSSSTLSSS